MSFSRVQEPRVVYAGRSLSGALAGIGFSLAAEPDAGANIEDTLLAASIAGMEHDNLRVLAHLVTWLGTHHARINADRLIRVVKAHQSPRVSSFWAAVAAWLSKDRRFARLTKLHRGKPIDVLATGTAAQIKRRGEDERFKGTALRVPAGVLRNRASDVLAPVELAKRHRAYRHRVHIGPSYRADMWAELERDAELTSSELARRTYGSFATAWQVKRDFELLAA